MGLFDFDDDWLSDLEELNIEPDPGGEDDDGDGDGDGVWICRTCGEASTEVVADDDGSVECPSCGSDDVDFVED